MIHGMTVIEEIMLQRKNHMKGVKFAHEYEIHAKLHLFSDTFKQPASTYQECLSHLKHSGVALHEDCTSNTDSVRSHAMPVFEEMEGRCSSLPALLY